MGQPRLTRLRATNMQELSYLFFCQSIRSVTRPAAPQPRATRKDHRERMVIVFGEAGGAGLGYERARRNNEETLHAQLLSQCRGTATDTGRKRHKEASNLQQGSLQR